MRSVREGRERGRTCGGEHLEQIEVAGQHPLDPAGAIAPRRVANEGIGLQAWLGSLCGASASERRSSSDPIVTLGFLGFRRVRANAQ